MIHAFLNACGAEGPLLLSTESPGAPGGETRAFDLPFVLIGRDPRSDLRLSDREVSDRHAYLQLVDGQLICIDLGSRSGVHQGGKRQRLAYLERDRAVRIGPYRIRLLGGDAAPAALADEPCLPLVLELAHRSVSRSRCELPKGLALVGSASDCQIRLVDPSVSSYHCSLVHTSRGVWVVDLLGQGGVRVNGQEVGYARLHEGDALQVGHSIIRLAPEAEPTAADSSWYGDDTPPIMAHPVPLLKPLAAQAAVSPATLAAPASSAAIAELAERMMGPMVSQFELMQQQMMDEFHQARAMMFETFASLHQEQAAFLSAELDEIRQLSQELQGLRADLERQSRLLAERVPAATSPSTDLVIALSPPERDDARESAHPGAAKFKAGRTPPFSSPPRTEPHSRPVRVHDEGAHAKLCARIVKLQHKQTSRWEKLFSLFPNLTPPKKPAH